MEFWKILLRELIYSEFIFQKLPFEILDEVEQFINDTNPKTIDEISAVFIKIANGDFTLIIDDFNTYNDFARLILQQLIIILQINNIKVILSESTVHEIISSELQNCHVFNLTPFTEKEANNFIQQK